MPLYWNQVDISKVKVGKMVTKNKYGGKQLERKVTYDGGRLCFLTPNGINSKINNAPSDRKKDENDNIVPNHDVKKFELSLEITDHPEFIEFLDELSEHIKKQLSHAETKKEWRAIQFSNEDIAAEMDKTVDEVYHYFKATLWRNQRIRYKGTAEKGRPPLNDEVGKYQGKTMLGKKLINGIYAINVTDTFSGNVTKIRLSVADAMVDSVGGSSDVIHIPEEEFGEYDPNKESQISAAREDVDQEDDIDSFSKLSFDE